MPSSQMQQVIDAFRQRRAAWANGPADVAAERIDAGGARAWWLTAPDVRSDEILRHLHGGGLALGLPMPSATPGSRFPARPY
jgi:hypothetical protein